MKRGKTKKKAGGKKAKPRAKKRPAKRRLRRLTADDGAPGGPPR